MAKAVPDAWSDQVKKSTESRAAAPKGRVEVLREDLRSSGPT